MRGYNLISWAFFSLDFLQRGNHKSISQALEQARELLAKDVKHGFTIPLPIECAPRIKGGMIEPLGVVKQCFLNEHNERVTKFGA